MHAKLFACGVFLTASLPALAEERDVAPVPSATRVAEVSAIPARITAKVRPVPFVLPARSAPAPRQAQTLLSVDPRGAGALVPSGERSPSGRPADSADGWSRVVREALDDHPKPRQPRSVLSTALVLRIDGDSDSPPVSVGGGGMAGVLWRAMPRN